MADPPEPDVLADWLLKYALDLARREHSDEDLEAMRPLLMAFARRKAEELRHLSGNAFPQGADEPTN
jgi:hypothetical protein